MADKKTKNEVIGEVGIIEEIGTEQIEDEGEFDWSKATTELPQSQTAQSEVEESTIEAMPHPQPETAMRPFFFPPDFSCEAESLEEATKLFEEHSKGAH